MLVRRKWIFGSGGPLSHMLKRFNGYRSGQRSECNQSILMAEGSRSVDLSADEGGQKMAGKPLTSPQADNNRPSTEPTAGQRHPVNRVQNAAPLFTDASFPRIRGEYLEQLFFSAPEHNADTCTVCRRRIAARSRTTLNYRRRSSRPEQHTNVGEDEGFAEGSENAHPVDRVQSSKHDGRSHIDSDNRLPPQTVITRVLRELEDDFTHYKG